MHKICPKSPELSPVGMNLHTEAELNDTNIYIYVYQ